MWPRHRRGLLSGRKRVRYVWAVRETQRGGEGEGGGVEGGGGGVGAGDGDLGVVEVMT